MTNAKKVGGLLFLLAIPVIILVFLQEFGQQHYNVPTDPAEAEGLSAEVPAGSLGKEFRFTSSPVTNEGMSTPSNLLLGKQTILFPLTVADTDTMQLVLEKLTRVQDVFEEEKTVKILVITRTQQLDKLSQLATQYRSEPQRWQFLADTTRTNIISPALPAGTSSSTLLLVDGDQTIRGYYDGMQEDEIDRLVVETRILLYGVK